MIFDCCAAEPRLGCATAAGDPASASFIAGIRAEFKRDLPAYNDTAVTALADPRRFAAPGSDPAVSLASDWLNAAAPQDGPASPRLVSWLRDRAAQGRDAQIAASLRAATSRATYRCLWESLVQAVSPDTRTGAVALPFAFPLLIVTGGRAPANVPGVLRDIGRVRAVLEGSGVLGHVTNFGLGNALCSLPALQAVQPSRLYTLAREIFPGALDLPPADIAVTTSDEQVHLRFLLGAAVTPVHAPTFLETGSAVATWGMALTRELSEQLATDGLSVLPLPRPPATLLRAQELGRRAREELAFQAFASSVLRRFRAEVGEPQVSVAALDSVAIGVRFASPFVENRVAVHEWALHPLDDLAEIAASILGLLRECRVENVQVLPGVLPAARFRL
jgi:hypothetical protein